MSPTRSFLIAALLGSSLPLRAEDPATETTAPDPGAEAPRSTDLPAEPAAAPAAPSQNVTINLINRLVQKKILTQDEAAELIKQAEADAATAQKAAAEADIAAVTPPPKEDDLRVAYIPEVVRNNMRDQIKQELMAQARTEEWGKQSAPDWTSKFRPFGDIRARYEGIWYSDGNDTSAVFPNFNAINTGAPYDASKSNPNYAPQYNVDQNRNRDRIRARFGTDIFLGEGFNAGIRLATGDSSTPVSTNQTLGGSGGDFSKYQIWLDRAFISYDAGPGDGEELTFLLGRFDNPFFSTDIQWYHDIGFDGFAVRGKVALSDAVKTFFAAGYFPVYNTDLNFASNQPSKFKSTDKWLTGAQLGVEWKIADHLTGKFAVAYYDFSNIEGKLSSPFIPLSASDAGNTDTTRPSFAQTGNTYMALRNIDNSTSANNFGNQYQYQYYGLATPFRNLTLTGKLDYDAFDPIRLSLLGEVTKNIAFDEQSVARIAVNNRGPGADGKPGAYQGGDSAWYLAFQIGNPALEKFGDWQVGFGYRYVESDSVVDGFTDSDFAGGGTNVKGFTFGGNLGLSHAVYCGARWMSSNQIAGPPLSTDILQIDLNAKF